MLTLLLACAPPEDAPTLYLPPDLTLPLEAGEVRAGEVVDEAALFGGISAEGRLGDFKIYNSRARFIVQGPRDGDYYMQQPGGVIDADAARPPAQVGG